MTLDGKNVRSPSKVGDHVEILIHCDGSSAVVAIVGAYRSEAVLRRVGKVFIFDTYVNLSVFYINHHKSSGITLASALLYSHPSMPPFPVARKRPLHSAGSHSSKDKLDLLDVDIESPTRQRSTLTSWLDRLQERSLSGNVSFVPAFAYSRT